MYVVQTTKYIFCISIYLNSKIIQIFIVHCVAKSVSTGKSNSKNKSKFLNKVYEVQSSSTK